MKDLVEEYLFVNKKCPLPGIGSLIINEGSAVAWHGDNKMAAPVPRIAFTDQELDSTSFIHFIAGRKKQGDDAAAESLAQFCNSLKALKTYDEVNLELAGKFLIDASGTLIFKQEPVSKEFLPSIYFKRVVHAKPALHAVRVGDTETTSDVMTEYYSEKEKVKQYKWWIFAIILLLAGAGLLGYYFSEHKLAENFGNTQPVVPAVTEQTYREK